MYFTIREELRAHVVEMIALLEVAIIIENSRIINESNLLVEAVQFIEGLLLEFISEPCRNVALLVCP